MTESYTQDMSLPTVSVADLEGFLVDLPLSVKYKGRSTKNIKWSVKVTTTAYKI